MGGGGLQADGSLDIVVQQSEGGAELVVAPPKWPRGRPRKTPATTSEMEQIPAAGDSEEIPVPAVDEPVEPPPPADAEPEVPPLNGNNVT